MDSIEDATEEHSRRGVDWRLTGEIAVQGKMKVPSRGLMQPHLCMNITTWRLRSRAIF
jgi:hypothetical protein